MRRLLVFGLQAGEIGGEIGYILVAKFGDDEIHHLVLALTSLVGLQTLYEVVLVLTADVRRVRNFADTIQPVAGLAFQGFLASCFRIAGYGRSPRQKDGGKKRRRANQISSLHR